MSTALSLDPSSTLQYTHGGLTQGTQYGRINVTGVLDACRYVASIVDSRLHTGVGQPVRSIQPGQHQRHVLAAAVADLPGGLTWNTSLLNTTGVISVGGAIGDYNLNSTVDAADYVVFRKTAGQTGIGLAADSNFNNQIDDGDYNAWRANFGQTVPAAGSESAASAFVAVPEPATAGTLLFFAAAGWCLRRRRAA